jgi:hypothetical protein
MQPAKNGYGVIAEAVVEALKQGESSASLHDLSADAPVQQGFLNGVKV